MHVRRRSSSRRQMSINLRSGWRRKRDASMQRACWGVLSLGIVGGTSIRIIADGPDEEEAVENLVDLVKSGFAE